MENWYHEGQREFQDRFDTRRLADRLAEAAGDTFSDDRSRFIEARDMFFIATPIPTGAGVLLQGRRAGLRARRRRPHDRLPGLRRQRHVPARSATSG